MNAETPDSKNLWAFFKQHSEGVSLIAFLLFGTLYEYGNRFSFVLSSAGNLIVCLIFVSIILFAKIKLREGIITSVFIGFLGAATFILSSTALMGLAKFLFDVDMLPNPMSSYNY
ncbi:MAG: hypothetical protein WC521_07150 [Bdellovibrionales bacterium]